MIITCPSNMIALSNGKLIQVSEFDSNRRKWHFRQDIPHVSYLTSFVVGEFVRIEDAWEGIPIEYYLPPGREKDAARSFAKTPKQMELFSKLTGVRYPFAKYAIAVVSGFTYGGMENITATTLDDKTLHNEREHMDFTSEDQAAHELTSSVVRQLDHL